MSFDEPTNRKSDISQFFNSCEQTRLIFSKSKVRIYKESFSRRNELGYLILIEKIPKHQLTKSIDIKNIFLFWIPESFVISSDDYEAYRSVEENNYSNNDRNEYIVSLPLNSDEDIHFISLLKIHSLLIKPPKNESIGSITINTHEKNNYLALFFNDNEYINENLYNKISLEENTEPFNEEKKILWGGECLLIQLKSIINIKHSSTEENVYIVNHDSIDTVNIQSINNNNQEKTKDIKEDTKIETLKKACKKARWNILERFSLITRFSHQKTKDILNTSFAKNILLSNFPPQLQKLLNSEQTINMMEEYDAARLYLARWAARIAEDSEKDKHNKIIWSSKDTNTWNEKILSNNFEMLELNTFENNMKMTNDPILEKHWKIWFNDIGKLWKTEKSIKENIFYRSIHCNIRKEVWCFLLEIYPWDSSEEERKIIFLEKSDRYMQLKQGWQNNKEKQAGEVFKDQKCRIEKDVHRTDRKIKSSTEINYHLETMTNILLTYNEYNKDLGYVQGMCDLLSPLYIVIENEVLSFWAFVNFMKRMQYNFSEDQSGMRKQLMILDQLIQLMDPKFYAHLENASSTNFFFFFRMLLVWFKREFEWDDVLRLWEILWTDHITSQFHLFVALAILDKHKEIIMDHLKDFDEILKYINDLSMTIDLGSTLRRAISLFYKFKQIVETIDADFIKDISSTDNSEKQEHDITKNNSNYLQNQNENSPLISNYLRELLNTDSNI
ncbi:hypothetical protein T552_02698 [Pneumocystis carinii B80]|uniref:GTPase-activating protein GYP7 n=1 Tax=Pneumocystis carinii (strain B80) TaxID=1408658 RepID=A0A0W4ZEA0_PNEC8|nr:hypothetical protein T552_02698 [Pneumocystis carinii B80]KTW26691.1 hypothetical protein T552_02698 [Pneumocystis carinii B80]